MRLSSHIPIYLFIVPSAHSILILGEHKTIPKVQKAPEIELYFINNENNKSK